MQSVFVYGSLKRGNKTRGMQHFPNAEFVGVTRTKRALFRMIDLGSFPGVMIIENDGGKYVEEGFQIEGEVYRVNDEDLEALDSIEGVPFFYDRQEINTTLGPVHMYLLPNTGEYDGAPTHEDRQEVMYDEQTKTTQEVNIPKSNNIVLKPGEGGRKSLSWTG
jgi:gamma-glutamylcyclotransferase (GGCT)/AIG2-like uncharacterized protein YtfP